MSNQYNLKNIRALLVEGFSERDLRTFCFDEPDFEDVHNQLSQSTRKDEIVQLLLDHARRKSLIENLLTWAKEHNPAMYEKCQPYHIAKGRLGPWRILVVDDHPGWQRILKTNFNRLKLKCTVVFASDYAEAKEHLTTPDFDLATIDLELDKSVEFAEGLGLISEIREIFGPDFPIIIVTGKGDLDRQRRAFKDYNVIDFIEKAKFNDQEFKEIVIEVINRSS